MRAILRMAWRNVAKNWRHSLAALLSMTAGFVALGLFEGYISDLRERYGEVYRVRGMLGDLIIERRGAHDAGLSDSWAYVLGSEDQAFLDEHLAASGEVETRVRFLELSGMVTNGKTSTVFVGRGHDVAEGRAMRGETWAWDVQAGKPLFAASAGADVILVGQGLGRMLDCRAEPGARRHDADGHPVAVEHPFSCKRSRVQLSTATQSGQLNAVDPEIAGITEVALKGLDLRFVSMSLPLAQRLAGTQAVTRYTVKLRDRARAPAFAQRLRAEAARRGLALEVVPWQQHPVGAIFTRGLELLGVFRNFVMLVVVVVAGMSVFNSMAKAVSERVREIGTLRSLGFLRRDVVLLFTSEAAILAALAVAIGVAILGPLVWLIGRAGISYKAGLLAEAITLEVAYVPTTYLVAAGFLGGIAVVAAFLAARRAVWMKIPDALGHV